MKSGSILSGIALACLLFSAQSQACCYPSNRLAIQAAMATGGVLGMGLVNFTETTELGLTLSGNYNNARCSTRTITPVLFGGLRQNICCNTYFAYGIDLASTFGQQHGLSIHSDYHVGPYISIEQMLTPHVMLAGWIQPYQYAYERIGCSSVSTQSFFSTGGIAINYLF